MRSLSHTLLLCVFALSGISCTSCSGEKHPSPPHYEPERPDPLTAEPYAWEASRQEVPAVTDLVLLYGGGHHRSPYAWDAERLSDYVTYTDTDGKTYWLFDGFLLLEIMDPAVGEGAGVKFANGYTYNNQPLRSATREDWQRLIDYCFAEDTGIGALEQVVAAASRPSSGVSSSPFPNRSATAMSIQR